MMGPPPRSYDEKKLIISEEKLMDKSKEECECELRCSICLDSYIIGDMIRFCKNKHIFYHKCLMRWLHVSPIPWCPECRSFEAIGKFELWHIEKTIWCHTWSVGRKKDKEEKMIEKEKSKQTRTSQSSLIKNKTFITKSFMIWYSMISYAVESV